MKRHSFAGIGRTWGFVQQQSISLRVVGENLGISSPIQGGIDLALNIFLGEVLVQNVPEKFQRNRPVRLPRKSIPNLLNQCDMIENSFAKELLSCCDICFCTFLSRRSNPHVSLR